MQKPRQRQNILFLLRHVHPLGKLMAQYRHIQAVYVCEIIIPAHSPKNPERMRRIITERNDLPCLLQKLIGVQILILPDDIFGQRFLQ